MKNPNSRNLARTWPYPKRSHYQRQMRKIATDWFAKRHSIVDEKYNFMLVRWEDWPENIILPEVVEYIQQTRANRAAKGKGFALHKYIHHGLSSQALLFNLVGPLIVRQDLALLETVFNKNDFEWPQQKVGAILEYEDRAIFNEDSGQPTSIDMVLVDEMDRPFLFIECKFTEGEFGGCSVFAKGDCDGRNPAQALSLCYLHHIGRRYWDLMEKHGFLQGPINNDKLCIMAQHYQFFRIVLFALEHQQPCVLLSDERSPTFICDGPMGQRGLLPLLLSLIPEKVRTQVLPITIQQVAKAIKESGRHPWITEFEEKYGLTQS